MATTPRTQDVYSIVTNQIITQLEKKVMPWHTSFATSGIPINLVSGEPYSGLNKWFLAFLNYSQNVFLTREQAKAIGATIKKGEEGYIVISWVPKKKLGHYAVFNIAQCTGIPADMIPTQQKVSEPIKRCMDIVARMPVPPAIETGGSAVFYNYHSDTILMPDTEFFTDDEMYYSNLFYALACSTWHEKRLDRTEFLRARRLATPKMYTTDELVAEMASSYLCSIAGIQPVHLRYNYLDAEGWLYRFRTHKDFIMVVSYLAERAVTYILNGTLATIPKSIKNIDEERVNFP